MNAGQRLLLDLAVRLSYSHAQLPNDHFDVHLKIFMGLSACTMKVTEDDKQRAQVI